MNNFFELIKETWNEGIRGFGIGEIIICLIIIFTSWLLGKFFSNKLIDWLSKKADQTENELDDQIIESLRSPLGLIPIVFGFYLITSYLPLQGSIDFFATNLVKMLVIFTIFSALANLVGPLLSLLNSKFMTEAMKDWLRRTIEVLVWIIAVAMILDIWGIQIGPIVAGLGLFGVAFAGFPVSFLGILFIALVGWRLVKLRKEGSVQRPLVDIQDYLVEMTIPEESSLVGKRIHELTSQLGTDNVLMGVVSDKGTIRKPHHRETFEALQIVVLKISPDDVAGIQTEFGLIIDPELEDPTQQGELGEIEAMITPRSRLIGRKYNYFKRMARGVLSLLGLWRQGTKLRRRLAREIFKAGDVLLLSTRDTDERAAEKLELLGLMPLWQRELDVMRDTSKVWQALLIFALALIAVIFYEVNIIVAFLLCVLAYASRRLLTGDGMYRHIEWPVVVMLGAMIPIGGALTSSGLTVTSANFITTYLSGINIAWVLVVILVFTMFISDLINNAATAVIMAPVSIQVANQMGQPIEPFLMAVAVGASCAFLSPIGHQCNTLVMGPGNYRFGDYWKLGLPLEILIACISIPVIMATWF